MILKLLSKVRVHPQSGCWEFFGKRHPDGYGEHRENGKIRKNHRTMWEHYHGPIPSGKIIRHKCDNPPCMNPDHLEIGTKHDNTMDSVIRGRHNGVTKTHCKRGHEFTAENTYTFRNMRHCKKCRSIRRNNESK